MICTRCEGAGFLNIHQIPETKTEMSIQEITLWIARNKEHDVQVCDCCGDGEIWYGIPGEHYNTDDPIGSDGHYSYNGGLCECH